MRRMTPYMGLLVGLAILLLPTVSEAKKKPAPKPVLPPPAVTTPAPVPVPTPSVQAASTGSLWGVGESSLFTSRPHGVGDTLTISILQASSASTSAAHTTAKSTSATLSPGVGLLRNFGGLAANGTRATDGSGNSISSTQIVDALTVVVTCVLPNGNLRIEGSRKVKLQKDEQILTFSGEVNPRDIGPDNTISSAMVANQQLTSKGTGPIAEKQNPGLFSRLLSLIF